MSVGSSASTKKPAKPTFAQSAASLGLLAVEILLPPLLAVAIVAWLFTHYNLWSMGAVLAQILFGLSAVLLAFMTVVLLDMLPAAKRSPKGVIGGGPIARLLKFALGGLLLPIALAVAVNLVTLPGGGSALNAFIGLVTPPVTSTPPDEVAQAAFDSDNQSVKRSGIEVLGKFQSAEALTQLLRLATEDQSALRDAATARSLALAIAAYGAQARDPLLALFNAVDPVAAGGALSDDLYGRYFAGGFEGLAEEVQRDHPQEAARVETARQELETALQDLQAASAASSGADPRPLFALQTLQAMNLSSDADLLAFAQGVAGDARYNAEIRGEALLLVGKLGGQTELSGLYALMANPDPLIQTRALQAVSAILSKGSATTTK